MDEDRILIKIDQMNSFLEEIDKIKLYSFKEYKNSIKDRRSCERLLQISIETVLDICDILVSELKLGLPSEEEEIFVKLRGRRVISEKMTSILRGMKGFRNILVHKYGVVKDELVFEFLSEKLEDFERFKEEILKFLKNYNKEMFK